MLITTIALSRSGRILICGGQEGHVRSYRFPFSNHNVWEDYVGHCDTIVKMRITLNDEYLVTVSNDGSIMVWMLQERDSRNVKIERDVSWAEEVLITRSDLEEKVFWQKRSHTLRDYLPSGLSGRCEVALIPHFNNVHDHSTVAGKWGQRRLNIHDFTRGQTKIFTRSKILQVMARNRISRLSLS